MRTVQDLLDEMTSCARDLFHGMREELPAEIAGKLTAGKAKDWRTHGKYIAQCMGVESLTEVNLSQLHHGMISELDQYLKEIGRGDEVRRNTKNTLKLVLDIAIAKGILAPEQINRTIPKRNPLYEMRNGQKICLRPPLRPFYEPYAINYNDFNPILKREVDQLKHYFTARVVRGRKGKAIDDTTWGAHLERIQRFFGAMSKLGDPHEDARLQDFVAIDNLERYADFFVDAHDDTPTHTLKDLLFWAMNIAGNYYKEKAVADEISSFINQIDFERIKDLDDIVMRITADDLYELEDKLVQHAYAYDHLHYRRKPCAAVRYPQAMVAWHYCRALTIMLSNRCWFRRSNLFGIIWGRHLYFYEGRLYFKFSAKEMKSKEPHLGQVVDLWGHQAGYNRLIQVLNRYLEVRHHLVAKFKLNHPDAPEPQELILNSDGKPYAPNGAWMMFSSVSRAYLGNEKEIFPHASRLIVPTYLMLEFDYAILGSIQAILDHKSIQTTERHYLRMKRLMSGQAAQKVMDERAARESQARSIEKMERILLELRSQFSDLPRLPSQT